MEECNPRNLTGTNYSNACDYVRNVEFCSFDSGFFKYFEWQYCAFDNRISPTILMIGWFLVLLLAIAVTADSFFAPCLVAVTKILRMSQNLAGVTLLALGNGAADVFSSLSAVMSSNRPNVNLALGSILGAGILVNAVTAGIIMIIVPFSVMRRPIIKDLVFYLIAIIWCMVILILRRIELWSALVFLSLYLVYVLVTGVSRAIYVKYEKNQKKEEPKEIKEVSDDNEPENTRSPIQIQIGPSIQIENSYEETYPYSIPRSNHDTPRELRSVDLLGLPPTMIRLQSLKSNSIRYTSSRSMGSFAKKIIENELQKKLLLKKEMKEQNFSITRERSMSLDTQHPTEALTKRIRFISMNQPQKELPSNKSIYKISETKKETIQKIEESPTPSRLASSDSTAAIIPEETIEQSQEDEFPGLIKHFLITILPINLEDWKEQSIFSKIISIIQSPIMFILTMTIPVVDNEAYLKGWCKILNCLHCLLSPLVWVVFIKVAMIPIGKSEFYVIYIVIIIGALCALFLIFTSKGDCPPFYYPVCAFIGFITSIIWIYELANEIVNVLETFGVVLKIPQTVLGLSVLAFANSIGDLVSNIMLARKNFPRIAYAACIGGPLFNLLVGIGLPFSIATATVGTIKIKLASETIVLIFTIMLITVMNLFALPAMKFHVRPFYGIFLLIIYVVFFIVVILFALNIIKVRV